MKLGHVHSAFCVALFATVIIVSGCSDSGTNPIASTGVSYPRIEEGLLIPPYPTALERVADPKARYAVTLLKRFDSYADSLRTAHIPPQGIKFAVDVTDSSSTTHASWVGAHAGIDTAHHSLELVSHEPDGRDYTPMIAKHLVVEASPGFHAAYFEHSDQFGYESAYGGINANDISFNSSDGDYKLSALNIGNGLGVFRLRENRVTGYGPSYSIVYVPGSSLESRLSITTEGVSGYFTAWWDSDGNGRWETKGGNGEILDMGTWIVR